MANELKNKRGLIKDRLTKLQHKVSRDEMSLGNKKKEEKGKAVRVIGELSKETVNSADAVRDSLGIQIECTRDLEKEAEALRNNMGKLEQAVGEFKLNNDELAE